MVRRIGHGLGGLVLCCVLVGGCEKPAPAAAQRPEEVLAAKKVEASGALAVKPDPVGAQKPEIEDVEGKAEPAWAPAVKPKPLSENVKRGLAWLVKRQHESGGWGQGEESQHMGRTLDHLKDKPNVADTCVALLALIRSGSTPKEGPYAANITSGLEFVCGEVAKVDGESLYVTSIRGTRLQMKLGTYIDTFLASMLLAEVKGRMPDEKAEKTVLAALDKVMDKIERNQRPDGTFGGTGWANSLSLAMASKGMNRASQAGIEVSDVLLERAEKDGQEQFNVSTGGFSRVRSAGVDLYAGAASLSQMQDSDNTNKQKEQELLAQLSVTSGPAERRAIQTTLRRFDENEQALKAAKVAIVKKLDDKGFIAGFGSNGGEEFLSYMNIGESLVVEGDDTWKKWDKDITANLNRIQNKDGSWTGHHCITGRTFCTSAALLTLMVDRAPVPVAAKIKRR